MFETDSDVRLYAGRVDAQVTSLDRDLKAYLGSKWGPFSEGMPKAPTNDKETADKSADIVFYYDWANFRDAWYAVKADIDNTSLIILSANKYREIEKYDVDTKAWRQKLTAKGVSVNAPATTDPGTVPGVIAPTNPDAPGHEPGTVGGINVGKVGMDILKIGAIAGIGLIAFKVISSATEK